MKLFIDYTPPNWNEYINAERKNKYIANNIKQEEKRIVRLLTRGKQYTGNYPVEVIVRPHYNAYRQDLDNCRYKGLLDGLVSAGVLKNDNLRHIQRITLEPIFDDKAGVEIEIKELEKMTQRDAIIEYITEFGSITPMEAFSDLGITKLATRISEMRKDGWNFKIETVKRMNRYGKPVYYARYSFEEGQ